MTTSTGSRLRAARERAGLTQFQLAHGSSVALRAIANYEADASKPSADSAVKIARALGVSIDWLLDGPSDHPPTLQLGADSKECA